jgi:RNA polymerase sigma factor (TIGR02999 family)
MHSLSGRIARCDRFDAESSSDIQVASYHDLEKMSHEAQSAQVTEILRQVQAGEPGASQRLLPVVYDQLRALARARLAKTPPGNTLQATALVHEAYLRLVDDQGEGSWDDRGHFFGAAAQAMRDVLVEQARRKSRLKAGAGRRRVGLAGADGEFDTPVIDAPMGVGEDPERMLALDQALTRLREARALAAKPPFAGDVELRGALEELNALLVTTTAPGNP